MLLSLECISLSQNVLFLLMFWKISWHLSALFLSQFDPKGWNASPTLSVMQKITKTNQCQILRNVKTWWKERKTVIFPWKRKSIISQVMSKKHEVIKFLFILPIWRKVGRDELILIFLWNWITNVFSQINFTKFLSLT